VVSGLRKHMKLVLFDVDDLVESYEDNLGQPANPRTPLDDYHNTAMRSNHK
jgi:hypothetical protein